MLDLPRIGKFLAVFWKNESPGPPYIIEVNPAGVGFEGNRVHERSAKILPLVPNILKLFKDLFNFCFS